MAEGFPTNITIIGFLSCVNPLMHSHGKTTAGGFATHVAFESFPTINAIKRFLSGMEAPNMRDKGHVVPEGFPTLTAFVGKLATVTSLVLSKS